MTFQFWCGFFSSVFLTSMYQDVLGQKGYIRAVNRNWADTHWAFWAFLLAVALVWSVVDYLGQYQRPPRILVVTKSKTGKVEVTEEA